jgi:hypothetical protein
MYNRDYSKEVGLDRGDRIVPLGYVIPVAVLLAALCWFGAVAWTRHESGSQATTREASRVIIQS